MNKTHEVTVKLNLDNDMVAAWFDRLMESTRHPMYQNGIQISKMVEVEE